MRPPPHLPIRLCDAHEKGLLLHQPSFLYECFLFARSIFSNKNKKKQQLIEWSQRLVTQQNEPVSCTACERSHGRVWSCFSRYKSFTINHFRPVNEKPGTAGAATAPDSVVNNMQNSASPHHISSTGGATAERKKSALFPLKQKPPNDHLAEELSVNIIINIVPHSISTSPQSGKSLAQLTTKPTPTRIHLFMCNFIRSRSTGRRNTQHNPFCEFITLPNTCASS